MLSFIQHPCKASFVHKSSFSKSVFLWLKECRRFWKMRLVDEYFPFGHLEVNTQFWSDLLMCLSPWRWISINCKEVGEEKSFSELSLTHQILGLVMEQSWLLWHSPPPPTPTNKPCSMLAVVSGTEQVCRRLVKKVKENLTQSLQFCTRS